MPRLPSLLPLTVCSITLLMLACFAMGCGKAQGRSESTAVDVDQELSAPQIAKRMIATYQNAATYHDRGILRVAYQHAGQKFESVEDLRVAFERPNRIRVHAYNVQLASDGAMLRYQVVDEHSGNMDQQFVQRPVQARIDLDELAEADPILDHFISGGAGPPVQIELLNSRNPLEAFFSQDNQWSLLTAKEFDGHSCYRAAVSTSHGQFELWIDKQQFLLRKLVFPATSFLRELAQVDGISKLKLVAEFPGAAIGETYEPGFDLPASRSAKKVKYFVTLPPPLPTHMFGQRPDSFHFTMLDGNKLSQEDLDGDLAVLVWFGNQPASQFNLQKLDAVAKATEDSAEVRFLAVCTVPSTVASHRDIADLVAPWGIDLSVVRDLGPFGGREFGVTSLPTLVVLDAAGSVQYFEVLEQPHLDQVLPVVIERLRAGDDLAAEILAEYRGQLDQYHRELAVAQSDDRAAPSVEPRSARPQEVTEQSSSIELRRLWQCMELTAAGNLLPGVELNSGEPGIAVVDGWRSVALLDGQGNVKQRQSLDLPDRSAITYLRSAKDARGKRWFVATEILGKQAHVFDARWNRVCSFPRSDQEHGGIRDVQIADPDGDGEPEIYAAFWEELGLQQVSLQGKRLGENLTSPQVLSIVSLPRPLHADSGKLLASDGKGLLLTMDNHLSHDPAFTIKGHPVEMIFAASLSEVHSGLCGVYHQENDVLTMIGIDDDFRPSWTAELPAGVFRSQIQFVSAGQVDGHPEWMWLVARPDNSVHVISSDGQFQERAVFADPLTGIAMTTIEDESVLLLSSTGGVSAWRIRVAGKRIDRSSAE